MTRVKPPGPWKILPTETVRAQPMPWIEAIVMPWIRELSEAHARFRIPPYRPADRGSLIDVKGTRWMIEHGPAGIAYYAATDRDGQNYATHRGNTVIVWADTPIPLPQALVDLARKAS